MPELLSRAEAKSIANFYWALSDPSRVQVLDRIDQTGETYVVELVAAMDLSQPTISYHIKNLVAQGLVERRRGEHGVYWLTVTAAGKALTAQFRLDGAS